MIKYPPSPSYRLTQSLSQKNMSQVTIRRYQPKDEPAIQQITYQTGFKGQGLAGRDYFNDQRLWFLIFIYYYPRYEPQHCFVAVDDKDDLPIGFICGTPDTKTQIRRFARVVVPRIALRAIFFTSWRYPRTLANFIKMSTLWGALNPENEVDITDQYPAHLHINLLPDYHRQGLGSRLIITFEDHLRARSVTGLHLNTTNHNHKAVPFYKKHGYDLVQNIGPFPHPLLDNLHFLTFAKLLSRAPEEKCKGEQAIKPQAVAAPP